MINLLKKIKLYGIQKFIIFIFSELKNIFFMQLLKGSFSQNGEDLVIDKLLQYKTSGFYVDIGAYHPYRFSNTCRFYKKGWRGINIEPNSASYKRFIRSRPLDINLNIGIGLKKGNMDFYNLFPDTLSTFSKKDARKYKKIGFKNTGITKIKVERLDEILLKYCQRREIDFFSIDTEGFEMEVLKSNNWKNFRPTVICVESFTFKSNYTESKERTEIRKFLENVGYKKVFSNDTNIIYQSIKPYQVVSHLQNVYSRKSNSISNQDLSSYT